MIRVLCFLIFCIVLIKGDAEVPEGPPSGTRIVGGIKVNDRSAVAYQVSIRYYNQHICGGSIINENHILTASHCCFDTKKNLLPAKSLTAVAGDLNINNPTKYTVKAKVKHLFTHPRYSHADYSNDIAVLRIKSTFGKWNDMIKPVNLSNVLPAANTNCIVSGWGKLNYSDNYISDDLYLVTVPIVSQRDCTLYYPFNIRNGMFCAGFRKGKKDSCSGDSGGPFVCNETLVGVVSWGVECAAERKPGVYTDVSQYRDWINKQLTRSSSVVIALSPIVLTASLLRTFF